MSEYQEFDTVTRTTMNNTRDTEGTKLSTASKLQISFGIIIGAIAIGALITAVLAITKTEPSTSGGGGSGGDSLTSAQVVELQSWLTKMTFDSQNALTLLTDGGISANNGPAKSLGTIQCTSVDAGTWNGDVIAVTKGGTGLATTTNPNVLLCAGTTATGPFQPLSTNGTSGYVLTSNGSGLPSFQPAAFSPKYFILSYQVPAGTGPDNAGFVGNNTVTRQLNTLLNPSGTGCTLNPGPPSSFTLEAGTWIIYASAPALFVNSHMLALYDVTNNANIFSGTTEFLNTAGIVGRAFLTGAFTIASPTEYRMNHWVFSGYSAGTTELGYPSNAPFTNETYTIVNLTRIA